MSAIMVVATVVALLAPPSIDELLDKLAAARSGITRFEVVIDARMVVDRPHLYRIWCDGERYREDRLSDFVDGKFSRSIDCTNCPNRGQFFAVNYDRVFNPGLAASLKPLAARKDSGVRHPFRFAALGTTPEGVGDQVFFRDLRWYVAQGGAVKHVELTPQGGGLGYKIVVSTPRGNAKFEATLLPSRGFAVVRAEVSGEENGQVAGESCESELTNVAGYWLPKTCRYTNRTDGKVTELTQRIEYVSINKPIDPKVFSLAGMELTPNTLISTESGVLTWDGKQLEKATQLVGPQPEQRDPLAEEGRAKSLRLAIYGLAGAAVLAALYFLRRLAASFRAQPAEPIAARNPESDAAVTSDARG